MSRIIIKCIAIAVTLACSGCARRVTRNTRTESSDSLRAISIRADARKEATKTECLDSTVHEREDSVYIYDSIHVTEHADGSTDVFRLRDRYHMRTLADTRSRTMERTDSTSTSSCDTLAIMSTKKKVAESRKTTKTRNTLIGHILLFAALVVILAGAYSIIRKRIA